MGSSSNKSREQGIGILKRGRRRRRRTGSQVRMHNAPNRSSCISNTHGMASFRPPSPPSESCPTWPPHRRSRRPGARGDGRGRAAHLHHEAGAEYERPAREGGAGGRGRGRGHAPRTAHVSGQSPSFISACNVWVRNITCACHLMMEKHRQASGGESSTGLGDDSLLRGLSNVDFGTGNSLSFLVEPSMGSDSGGGGGFARGGSGGIGKGAR